MWPPKGFDFNFSEQTASWNGVQYSTVLLSRGQKWGIQDQLHDMIHYHTVQHCTACESQTVTVRNVSYSNSVLYSVLYWIGKWSRLARQVPQRRLFVACLRQVVWVIYSDKQQVGNSLFFSQRLFPNFVKFTQFTWAICSCAGLDVNLMVHQIDVIGYNWWHQW